MSNQLLDAAKAAKNFVESMRVPQDTVQAAIQIHSGRNMLDILENAIAAEEQRLADEQLPATREWIESIGGPVWRIGEGYSRSVASELSILVEDDGTLTLNLEASYGYGTEASIGKTRRQVLCLLEAMGVKL